MERRAIGYYLAEALALVNRQEAAAAEIARGIDLLKAENLTEAWLALRFAVLWSRVGHVAEAGQLIQAIRPRATDDAFDQSDLLLAEAERDLARGSIDRAIEGFRRAVALQSWWRTRSALANGLSRSANVQEAMTLLRQLVSDGAEPWEGHVHWVVMHLTLGRLYEQTGDPLKARDMYRALVDLWKEADADLKPLQDARAALARLPQ